MKTALKTMAILNIVIGSLSIIGGEGDYYALIGGAYYLVFGILVLVYMGKE